MLKRKGKGRCREMRPKRSARARSQSYAMPSLQAEVYRKPHCFNVDKDQGPAMWRMDLKTCKREAGRPVRRLFAGRNTMRPLTKVVAGGVEIKGQILEKLNEQNNRSW